MAADSLKLLILLAGCLEPLILFVGLGKPFSFIAVDLVPNDECGSIWLLLTTRSQTAFCGHLVFCSTGRDVFLKLFFLCVCDWRGIRGLKNRGILFVCLIFLSLFGFDEAFNHYA